MKRILKYLLKEKKSLIIGTMSMILIISIDQITPMLQKEIVDSGIIEGKYSIILPILFIFLALTLIKAILGYLKEYLYDYIGAKVHFDLRTELFSHIQSFEFEYFDNV